MRAFSTSRIGAILLTVAGLLAFAGTVAHAQGVPVTWDHYWVYDVIPGPVLPPPAPPVRLTDQFETWDHQVLQLRHFANPVEKQHGPLISPITNPDLHYTWWEIEPHPFQRPGIAVDNQFGPQLLDVFAPRFLLNPARKNQPGPPPPGNHYKCYECVGQPVLETVYLRDQFGQRTAVVLEPQLLCNPTVKQLPGGVSYPMLDPEQHLVCYRIDPMLWAYLPYVTDQFIQDFPLEIGPDRWLCVPSYKHEPTSTSSSTWGQLKSLYR